MQSSKGAAMKRFGWAAVPLILLGAALLVAGIGAEGYWVALIAVGIVLVIVARAPG
jgi:hypothetical protein